MTKTTDLKSAVRLVGLSAVTLLGACSTVANESPVPWDTSALDANPVTVALETQSLEVPLPATDAELRVGSVREIQAFVADYKSHGRGPLFVAVPGGGVNAQLAVKSAGDIREMAWVAGVDYLDIDMRGYDAAGDAAAPILMRFNSYVAVKPDCPLLSEVDLAEIDSNAELTTFGCALNSNFAAMIYEPADLAGNRDLDPPNNARLSSKYRSYVEGASTTSVRTAEAGLGGN